MKTCTKTCTKCGVSKSSNQCHPRGSTACTAICASCDRQRTTAYKINNADRLQKRDSDYQKKQRLNVKRLVLQRLGGRCITPGCGCCELHWLTISHENNDGKSHRTTLNGSQAVYRWVLKATDLQLQKAGISVRCIRCNFLLAWQREADIIEAIKREHQRIRGDL